MAYPHPRPPRQGAAASARSVWPRSAKATEQHAVPGVRPRPAFRRAGRPAEEAEDGGGAARRRGGRLLALGRLVLPRLRLRALLLRSRRALARLRDCYADMVKGLVADAAAAEAPVKARRMAEAGTGGTVATAGKPVVVPAAVAGAVLRCNSHYCIR